MQNLELNFLRLPICGCGACGIDCGGGCGYGCDPCACFQPSFGITGLCGVRYVRFDDDFLNAVQFADPTVPDPAYNGFDYASDTEIFHEISIDNELTGMQLGANMDWCVAPCWTLFWNSQFGVYGNHIEHYQRVFTGGGGVIRFVGDQQPVAVNSSKDDVSFLGEARLGTAYQLSKNCRLTAAWRVVAISGVALVTDQIHSFDNSASVARIDSQGSLIVHGVQVGSEFKF
jgi:hypothetical protein